MKLLKHIGTVLFLAAFLALNATLFVGKYSVGADDFKSFMLNNGISEEQLGLVMEHADPAIFEGTTNKFRIANELLGAIEAVNQSMQEQERWDALIWGQQDLVINLLKESGTGMLFTHTNLVFLLIFGIGLLGALLHIFSRYGPQAGGIRNNGVFTNSLNNRGWMGILLGTFLILFYVVIYWWPHFLVEWIVLVDPLAHKISGGGASQWFFYGLMYTILVLVMGLRFFFKYRHNKYQVVRTAVVTFFQLTTAFIIPHLLTTLNLPGRDLKNMWPLEYSFFFDWNINPMVENGTIGWFMLGWGIVLFLVGVPLFTYFLGKRWYCSWVCGCGGLAETAGDPFRHQSDKSLKAWKIERWVIHLVMVFALVMTVAVLYSLVADNPDKYWVTPLGLVVIISIVGALGAWVLLAGGVLKKMHRKYKIAGAGIFGVSVLALLAAHFTGSKNVFAVDAYQLRSWYGFGVGSIFAGVVGTGFYPLMGNRMWCRFGCPLAGYLGLIQRFKSRFRITTNGGQCISCGNCSTYCEQGIDVRAYAQRGENIVRASCVGCGVCSAVCPRGVLRLENGPEESRFNDSPIMIGNDGLLKLNEETIDV